MSSDRGSFDEFFQKEVDQHNIKREKDALLCNLHYSLVGKGYSCVGTGDKLPKECSVNSEGLPLGWAEGETATLLYQHQNPGQLFLVKVLSPELMILARFLDDKIFSLKVNPSDFVSNNFSSSNNAFKNLDHLWSRLEGDHLEAFRIPGEESTCSEPLTLGHSEIAQKNLEQFIKMVNEGQVGLGSQQAGPTIPPPFGLGSGLLQEPLRIGQNDLGPMGFGFGIFGGLGGGMIFDPMRPESQVGGVGEIGGPNMLPRGAVPPGARFDPFGPPDVEPTGRLNPEANNQTTGSDPDALNPPGFDDMLM